MILHDRLPSLAVLRCFEASAKYENYTAAAEVLGLTQSAVSRQVKELEDHIGAPLFRREGRGVRLTDAGQSLAKELSGDLERLRLTLHHAIAAGSSPGVLSIAAPPTFATRWLVPRLPQFRAEHSDLQLVLYSRSQPFDMNDEKVDLAVHFGSWDWPGTQLTPLCPEDLVVVAAPSLVGSASITISRDILDLPLIHLSSRPQLWSQFAHSLDGASVGRQGCTFDQFSLIIEAALAGMGVAILPTYLIETELSEGRFKKLSSVQSDGSKSYFVATPLGQTVPLATAFSTWLRKQVNKRA